MATNIGVLVDYHKLLLHPVTVGEVESGQIRGKIDFIADPTEEFIDEVLKPAVHKTAGCADITRVDYHDARFWLRFTAKVKNNHQAVADQYRLMVNSRVQMLGAESNPIIEEWLNGRTLVDDKDNGMAVPSEVGAYGNYDRDRS